MKELLFPAEMVDDLTGGSRRRSPVVRWAPPLSNGGAAVHTNVLRVPGGVYTFTVTAVNAAGAGKPSNHSGRVVPLR